MNMVEWWNNHLTSVGMDIDRVHVLVYIELRIIENALDELVL